MIGPFLILLAIMQGPSFIMRSMSANEMSDKEIMEKVFTPRIVRELDREYDLRTNENDSDTSSTPPHKEAS